MTPERETILYLDDESLNCRVFERCFQKYFDVIVTRSPNETLDILHNRPEITKVVTDYKMPEMNGMEFVKSARLRFENKSYYMLSGFEPPTEVFEAMQQGVVKSYFQKPLNRQLILSHLLCT